MNLATAYGLALQGLNLAAIDANLMPVAVLREAMWKGKVKWFAAAAALSVLAGGLSFTRYFMDKTRLEGNPPSGDIQTTKTLLKQLKSEWSTVETGYTPDFSAANASILLENRDVIPWVLDDVGHVLDAAANEAKRGTTTTEGPSGLTFEKLTTLYTSSGAEWDPSFDPTGGYGGPAAPAYPPGPPRTSKGGGGNTSAGGRGGDGLPGDQVGRPPRPKAAPPPPPTPSADGSSGGPADPDKQYPMGEGPPRVVVTLTVKTTRSDPFNFLTETVQKWLNDHKDRDGAPYPIKHVNWNRVNEEVIANDPNAPQMPTPIAAGGGNKTKGSVGPARPEEQQPIFDDLRSTATVAGDPNQLAPIPKAPPMAAPGTKVMTFEIKWEAYLKSWKPESAGGGA
jgi:hypothetical protein